MFMLQETVIAKPQFGLLKKGKWYIKTSKAVWDRVQIVGRSRRMIRVFYKLRHKRCIEDIPVHLIQEARQYTN